MAAKTWLVRFPTVPGGSDDKHRSKTSAYQTVSRLRADWKSGILRSARVNVYVDEGNGPQLYERIDLSEGQGRRTDLEKETRDGTV